MILDLDGSGAVRFEVDKVIVSFLHVLNVISKLLLAAVFYVGNGPTVSNDVSLTLFDGSISFFLFDLSADNNG